MMPAGIEKRISVSRSLFSEQPAVVLKRKTSGARRNHAVKQSYQVGSGTVGNGGSVAPPAGGGNDA